MEDQTLPLPTHEEVLICNEYTTDEEVTLLWKRAMGDPNHFRIFCLINAEKLSYQICDKVLRTLLDCSQGQRGKYVHKHLDFHFYISLRLQAGDYM